jgi:hypothetical protein
MSLWSLCSASGLSLKATVTTILTRKTMLRPRMTNKHAATGSRCLQVRDSKRFGRMVPDLRSRVHV